jgi:hypothetical protein
VAQVLTAKGGGQKENPMGEKHYVYSARTTDEGLALINKARGERGWDEFVNQAVAEHYGLDLGIIALPPSKFIEEQKSKREAREAEKVARKAEREAKAKDKAETRKAAEKKAKEKAKKAAEKKTKEGKENGK